MAVYAPGLRVLSLKKTLGFTTLADEVSKMSPHKVTLEPENTRRQTTECRNGGAPNGSRYAEKHGLTTLRDAATRLGSRAIDGRSALSYALKKRRRELVDDLGGPDNISTQQSALIGLCVKTKLFID